MADTNIEWATKVWNPTRGCRRVSSGCESCYAERQAIRHAGPGGHYEGLVRMSPSGPRWTGQARLVTGKLAEPLKWSGRQRVFVDSMSDLFYEGFSDEEIAAVFGVMAACPQHDFLVLTKRPARARDWFGWLSDAQDAGEWTECHWHALRTEPGMDGPIHRGGRSDGKRPWPLPNVWLGVSCEDQATADERIPLLLDIPAAVRFVSAEPLLGPVDLSHWLGLPAPELFDDDPLAAHLMHEALHVGRGSCRRALDWIIVGGESGPGARPFAVEWAEDIVAAGAAAAVPIFVKQLGAYVVSTNRVDLDGRWAWRAGLKDRKGGDPSEWPADLQVRQFPRPRGARASNEGAKQEVHPSAPVGNLPIVEER